MNVLEVHEGRERRERKHREKGEKREKEVWKMKKKMWDWILSTPIYFQFTPPFDYFNFFTYSFNLIKKTRKDWGHHWGNYPMAKWQPACRCWWVWAQDEGIWKCLQLYHCQDVLRWCWFWH
jgi:hypothetical protein